MQTVVPRWAIEQMKRFPALYRGARRARRLLGMARGPRSMAGLPGRVHPNDTMIAGADPSSIERYSEQGQQTIERFLGIAEEHLGLVARLDWMELGCGYGRLIRHLATHVPAQQISVTDIDQRAVEFCASEFDVRGLPSNRPTTELEFPPVDVLYAVSVISHLDLDAVDDLLRLVIRTVRPGGVAMLSTHGPSTLAHLEGYGPGWPEKRSVIEADLARKGWAYLPYPGLGMSYGLAWHDATFLSSRVRALGGAAVAAVEVLPRGLEKHQDLYLIRMSGVAEPSRPVATHQ